jgi:membrane-associated phospholipid phosphatase
VSLIVLVQRRSIFLRAMRALVIAYSLDLLVFALFPTVYPRVAAPPGAGWNQMAFNFLFAVDTPANCFPSGHITAPLIGFWAVAADNPRWRPWLWLTFALLCPTILTTKQHYVADLIGGFATGVFGVWLSGKITWGGANARPKL